MNKLKEYLKDDKNKRYIIGKCFFAKTSSMNTEECIAKSNEYLESVVTELQAEYFDSGNADLDLCCAVNAKVFVQGKGFFSKLIVEIRNQLGKHNILTE